VIQTSAHEGTLQAVHQFVEWESEGLAWSSMKVAEECDDVMIRWFNPAPESLSLQASIPDFTTYKSTILEEQTNESSDQYEVAGYEIITLGFQPNR
jgi:alpha-mannosidase